jgi:hypothetical protein
MTRNTLHPLARALNRHHDRKQAEHGEDRGERLCQVGDRIKFKAQMAYDCRSRWRKVTAVKTTPEGRHITQVTCVGWSDFAVHDYEILVVERDGIRVFEKEDN